MTTVSIVIPARDEAENIGALTARLLQAAAALPAYRFEYVFVDDASRDETAAGLRAFAAGRDDVRLLSTGMEPGLTNALRTGFAAATGDLIAFLPADLQSDPVTDLPLLLAPLAEGADLVLGVRRSRRGYKRLVTRVYHALARTCFGVSFRDMNWIKAFRRELLDEFHLRYEWHRYLPVFAHHAGRRVVEVDTDERVRTHGRSKFGPVSSFKGLQDLITLQFDLFFLRRPMRLFGTAGMLLLLLSALQATAMFTYLVATGFTVRLGAGIYAMLILLVFAGCQSFGFGLLAEYLAQLHEQLATLQKRERGR